MNDDSSLLEGIREITEKEIQELRTQAERFGKEKTASADKEIERLRAGAEERFSAQRERNSRQAQAAIDNERHRIALEAEERFFAIVLDAVLKRFRELVATDEYPSLLKSWIVEAAIGLEADAAAVQSSAAERPLCERVLDEAAREVKEKCGRTVALSMAQGAPLAEQGVVLTASSGRTAFNNQVRTRILRRESLVRKAIYEAMEKQQAAHTRTAPGGKQTTKQED